jgi:UDP-N-acetylmuramate dehydrogenase
LRPGDADVIRVTMREYNARRREKQPLTLPCCGSTFKRPPGGFAGTLIEQSGLKGLRVGGASVSTLHAGFLVNDEGGTARDYLALISEVQRLVKDRTDVWLEPEVRILGVDASEPEPKP